MKDSTGAPGAAFTLVILKALGREDEAGLHTEVALRNGLTPAEISEVLQQIHSLINVRCVSA